jgi:hypothetical protein
MSLIRDEAPESKEHVPQVSYIFKETKLANITERFTRQSDAQEAADMFPVRPKGRLDMFLYDTND